MRDARLKGWVVVLAMVPYVLLGYPWFSAFRDPWFHGGGLTVEQLRSGPGYATAFSLAIAAGVLTARVLAFLIARLEWTNALGGLRAGGLAWLGFVGPVYATQYTFEARSLAYFGITAGFPLIGFLGMGAILGRWGFRKTTSGRGAAGGPA